MKPTPLDLEERRTMLLGRARTLRYLWDWPAQVEVEDVVSSAIARALAQLDAFRGETHEAFTGWLLRILHSVTVDALRAYGAKKRDAARTYSFDEFISHSALGLENILGGQISSPSAKAYKAELLHAAYAAIELLPPRQQEALLLRFIAGWSIEEIADKMSRDQEPSPSPERPKGSEVTPKAVTSLVERALRKLKDLLKHLE